MNIGWTIYDTEQKHSLRDETGEVMVFVNYFIAAEILSYLRQAGFYKNGMLVPANDTFEISDN